MLHIYYSLSLCCVYNVIFVFHMYLHVYVVFVTIYVYIQHFGLLVYSLI